MRMNVDFASHVYEIEFEPFLGEEEMNYQNAFEEWYYEEVTMNIDGEECFVLQQKSTLPYTRFGINVVLDWMKQTSPASNPKIIKKTIGRKGYNKKLPSICF